MRNVLDWRSPASKTRRNVRKISLLTTNKQKHNCEKTVTSTSTYGKHRLLLLLQCGGRITALVRHCSNTYMGSLLSDRKPTMKVDIYPLLFAQRFTDRCRPSCTDVSIYKAYKVYSKHSVKFICNKFDYYVLTKRTA